MQHRGASKSIVGTMNNRPFLTANFLFIDICPDQEYLCQKLLPIYSKVREDEIPIPKLKAVARELALAEGCPKPDWNYLRWDGYSDQKYQVILNGSALLELNRHGENIPLELQVLSYYNGGKLAVLLVDWSGGEPEL